MNAHGNIKNRRRSTDKMTNLRALFIVIAAFIVFMASAMPGQVVPMYVGGFSK